METFNAKAKFAENLIRIDSSAFSTTVLYMVYKTIEANDNITLNQLRWSLHVEYLLSDRVVEGAVASLTAKPLFDCVCRWQPRSKKSREEKDPLNKPAVHLRVREDNKEFAAWIESTLKTHPELLVFEPSSFVRRSYIKDCMMTAKEA